jgi:type I restriction-modification system DNA methylase subunit
MKSKIKEKSTKIPSPFGETVHKTERTAVAILMHWMREIIDKKNLDLGMPDVETSAADRKMPDAVIYESGRSKNVLCVIEAKPPYYDVFNYEELKKPAWEKANKRKAKYFATTNFKRLIWFSTEKVNSLKPEEEQIIGKYSLSELENLDEIEQTRYSEPIKRGLEEFLVKLYSVHTGKEPEPKQAIDEFLIFRLQEKIRVLSTYYRRIIDDQCHKDNSFAKKLTSWFLEQGWSFAWQLQDFDKAARQTAYLLVNKILFYNLLQAKRPHELDPLEIPDGLTKGAMVQTNLQAYFNEVLKIDYETIYTTDFIDTIAFPDAKEVVKEIKGLVNFLKRYDFSKLGYDVIGRIFERLIPQDERHNLGQYFTNPDVVDLILRFCLHHEDDKILDPACGAGTFLVRAYQHKKLMNQYKSHEEILGSLWGNDIAKFPAHLSTINLAINDLGVDRNYPNILQEDFFRLLVAQQGFEVPESWRRARAVTLGVEERELTIPRWFDGVVGNPPYTRQEEIPEIGVDKEQLIESALKDPSGKKVADIGKRAGIHAYFFVHGAKFLKDSGYFGFIVSDTWLDVDYGKGLQEFFLKNYKIIAIIGSKVERWFEEADINTCIIILQKCKDKKERDENLVRFVYLKKPLRYFIPPAQDIWEKQVERLYAIDKLKKTILAHNYFYENEELQLRPKSQEDLWIEGFDLKEKKYIGTKWGKYLRAPQIFFKILEKGKNILMALGEIAEVKRGFTTGADHWFYVHDITNLTDKKKFQNLAKNQCYKGQYKNLRLIESGDRTRWLIEKEYIQPVIRNPEDYKKVFINMRSVEDFVVVINKTRKKVKGKLVEKYIIHGEKKVYNMGKDRSMVPAKTETCSARQYWFQLPDIKPSRILWQKAFDVSHRHYLTNKDILANQRFYLIYPKELQDVEPIIAFLNSPLVALNLECQRSVMGMGAIEATVDEVKQILIFNPNLLKDSTRIRVSRALLRLGQREVGSIFDEFGTFSPEQMSLDKVKPDRRELDKIILGEIIGLTDDEQIEVYRAVVDLVKSRIEKAKSFGKKRKTKEGIDVGSLKNAVIERIKKEI